MPGPLQLKLVLERFKANAGEAAASAKKDHYLFLLGTDTKFVPGPTFPIKDYERGETLSYSAQTITQLLDERPQVGLTLDHTFSSDSVDLLEGPDTMGRNVDEKIVKALFLVLKAVASGHHTINIIAHSRGAVEGILLIHELHRLKSALSAGAVPTLETLLRSSPDATISAAILKWFDFTNDDPQELQRFLNNALQTLTINAFLIDPVPGSGVSSRWHSELFFKPLPPGINCQLIWCRDERTHYFEPISPEGINPVIIPGHHGSMSGNVYTQTKGYPTGFDRLKATHAQDLALCKLFHFLTEATGDRLVNATTVARFQLGEHVALGEILTPYFRSNVSERLEYIIQLYQNVHKNDAHYAHCRKVSRNLL